MVLILFGILGLAVDGNNAFRLKDKLQITADIAAHAGVVVYANGGTVDAARAASTAAVAVNMPADRFGVVFADATTDVISRHWDPDSGTMSGTGADNAMTVQLHMNETINNPVRTFFLQMIGIGSFDVIVTSTAVFAETNACNSPDGIFAQSTVTLTSQSEIGAGFCVHSQTDVWLPQQNTFDLGSRISMPDLADCKSKCDDSANPGATAASIAANMLLEDLGEHINATAGSFLQVGGSDASIRNEFFSGKVISGDLSELAALNVLPFHLQAGQVITLTGGQFESLSNVPSGLTYNVLCTANGNGPSTRLTFNGQANGNPIKDIALITSCSLDFGASSAFEGSVVATLRQSASAAITASEGARVGVPGSCDPTKKVWIMSKSDMSTPASFSAANVSFIVDGNVNLASASSSLLNVGTSIRATGEVHLASGHRFDACNNDSTMLEPAINVIRYVF